LNTPDLFQYMLSIKYQWSWW